MLNIFKAILLAAVMSFVIAGLGERSKASSESFTDQKVKTPQSNDAKTVISQRVKILPE